MTKVEKTKAYNKTRKGLARRLYNHQIERCKTRGHSAPTYTKYEFEIWLYDQPNFEELFCIWQNSGYLKHLKPSVDRLDDYSSYSLENIQLTIWEKNNLKARQDTKTGKLYKATTCVSQHKKDGSLVLCYPSVTIAASKTNSNSKAIFENLSGRSRTSNGFIWRRMSTEDFQNYLIDEKTKEI